MTTSKQKAQPDLLSMAAYGKRQGVSHTAVRKAIDSGRLVKSVIRQGDKILINAQLADAEWLRNTDKSKQGNRPAKQEAVEAQAAENLAELVEAVKDSGAGQQVKKAAEEIVDNLVNGGMLDINTAREMKETYLALSAQIDYKKKLGTLIEREAVRKTAYTVGATVRNRLTALPARLAPQLLGQTSQAVITGIISAEVVQCLTELSETLLGMDSLMSDEDLGAELDTMREAARKEAEEDEDEDDGI